MGPIPGVAGGTADVSVRPASVADVPGIAAVQLRSWRTSYPDLLGPDLVAALTPEMLMTPWRAAVTAPPSGRHAVLVARAADMVVGFVTTGPSGDPDAGDDDGEIVALEVDPAHRGGGHGSRLLAAAADTLRAAGLRSVRAWVADADEPRRAFLTGAGLVPDGARRRLAREDGHAVEEIRLAAAIDPDGGP